MSRRRIYWICQIAGWGGLNAIKAIFIGFEFEYRWGVIANPVIHTALGIALTHAFRAFVRRRQWTKKTLPTLVPRVLAAVIMLGIVFTALFHAITYATPIELLVLEETDVSSVQYLAGRLLNAFIFLLLWTTLYFGIHSFWNYRQAEIDKWKLEARAETARLKALKLQLNPHFFFNSLNSVRALIAEDPKRAQQMVTRLARLLRTTLQVDDVKTVPLEEELSTVRTYLELERVRFEERLQYKVNAEEEALHHPVPLLLLQTLVENGIKHGIAKRQDGGVVTIGAEVRDEALRLCVTNPGTLESEEGGVGLENARERLRLLFGDDASLTLENEDPDTVVASVHLPLQGEDDASVERPLSAKARAEVRA